MYVLVYVYFWKQKIEIQKQNKQALKYTNQTAGFQLQYKSEPTKIFHTSAQIMLNQFTNNNNNNKYQKK